MKAIKANPCKYRSYDDKDAWCLKYVANNTGDVEPCDYCNTDFEEAQDAENQG